MTLIGSPTMELRTEHLHLHGLAKLVHPRLSLPTLALLIPSPSLPKLALSSLHFPMLSLNKPRLHMLRFSTLLLPKVALSRLHFRTLCLLKLPRPKMQDQLEEEPGPTMQP